MSGWKRTLTVSINMTQVICDLLSVQKAGDNDLVQLCTGANGLPAHAPEKPCWDPTCAHCGIVKRDALVKGSEITEGQYVVMTPDEIEALKADEARYKGQMMLTPHPFDEVAGHTERKGTTYALVPSTKKGVADQSAFYAVLLETIAKTPDIAYLTRYTVSTRAALYRLRVDKGLILADQMVPTDEYAELPVLDLPPVPEAMVTMIEDYARMAVTPFDPKSYENEYSAKLTNVIASREAVEAGRADPSAPDVAALTKQVDPFAAMQTQMAAALASKPAPAKKATARKPRKKAEPEAKAS